MTPEEDHSSKNKNGCEGYVVDVSSEMMSQSSLFYMVDRGGCSFIDKTSHAQAAGASGVIFSNDECLKEDLVYLKEKGKLSETEIREICCSLPFVNKGSPPCQDEGSYYEFLPFMVTSSTSQSGTVVIPAMLIRLTDSLKFKFCLCEVQPSLKDSYFCKRVDSSSHVLNKLKKNMNLNCKSPAGLVGVMTLDTPHPDGKVNWEIWMKPDAQPSLVLSIGWLSEALENKVDFKPKYVVHQTIQCNADSEEDGDICDEYCKKVGDKNICYLPQTDNMNLNGVDFLDEIQRQMCIFKKSEKDWWKYQEMYNSKSCVDKRDGISFKECSEEIIDTLKSANLKAVKECVEVDGKKILQQLDENQENMGIFDTAVVVNTRIMHFSLEPEEIGRRICDGFASHTLPHVCTCINKANTENQFKLCRECVKENNCASIIDSDQIIRPDDNKHASNKSLVMVLLFLIGLVGGAFLYTKQTKKQMRTEMRSLMQDYVPLRESGSHFERMMGSSTVGDPSNHEDANLI